MIKAENGRSRFDRMAAEWDANPARVALAAAVVAAIRQAVPLRPEMDVLDFGAGTGLVTLGLAPDVGKLTALDASREMVHALESKRVAAAVINVQTLWCDIAQAPLPPAAYDLIVSSMVLHHLSDVDTILARLRPCIRSGGWIALADLDAEDGSFHGDQTGVFHAGFPRPDICRRLIKAGFSGVQMRDAHQVVRAAADGTTRSYGVFLATARVA